eukprot:gene13000-13102_t
MSMFLLDAALKRLIHTGTVTLTEAGGRQRVYGSPREGWADLGLVLHDKGVPGKIARNPSLGFAEAYMDCRLDITGGDIMDFVGLVRRNNPWDSGRDLDNPGLLAKLRLAVVGRINRINARAATTECGPIWRHGGAAAPRYHPRLNPFGRKSRQLRKTRAGGPGRAFAPAAPRPGTGRAPVGPISTDLEMP